MEMTPEQSRRLGLPEFVALMAVMTAIVAFSIDSMLPAMPEIARELSPNDPNKAQLIITSFVFGMGLGTLFTGPLSDAFGRKPVIIVGTGVYIIGSVLAYASQSLELALAARVLQGLGAAGPRIASMAIIRDQYAGRQMARIISLVMMVFALIPAMGPLMGQGIIYLIGWRGIFLAFIVLGLLACTWLGIRQPETLAKPNRRPFRLSTIIAGTAEICRIRRVVLVIGSLSFTFALLFTMISTTQQVFDLTFGKAADFPYWFFAIAILSASGSIINARIVVRVGMRRLVAVGLGAELVFSVAFMALILTGLLSGTAYYYAYILWLFSIFFVAGITIGNLNALGMEPLGHLAGLGASVISSIATIAAVVLAIPIGLAFDGTPLPLTIGIAICSLLGMILVMMVEDVPDQS